MVLKGKDFKEVDTQAKVQYKCNSDQAAARNFPVDSYVSEKLEGISCSFPAVLKHHEILPSFPSSTISEIVCTIHSSVIRTVAPKNF